MQKTQLKQQAKSLLLKGCYKMAAVKYKRLIELGSQGFSQREWAVFHLNSAICHQFLEQFDSALQFATRSIQIDPTYEKAYYRRMQIFRELNRFQQAIGSVPSWIKNKEVIELQQQIRYQYLNSLGIDQILQNLIEKKELKLGQVKESHLRFYQRLEQQLQESLTEEQLSSISQKIAKYYVQLKAENQKQMLESFLAILHLLIVKALEKKQFIVIGLLLNGFWSQFDKLSQPLTGVMLKKEDIKTKQQYKLVRFAPITQKLVQFLRQVVNGPLIQQTEVFDFTIQFVRIMANTSTEDNFGQKIYDILKTLVVKLTQMMNHSLLSWLKHSLMLIDSLIKLHLNFEPAYQCSEMDLLTLFYLRYVYINSKSDQINEGFHTIEKIGLQKIVSFIQNNIQTFVVVYIFEQFAHRLDRTVLKELIPQLQGQIQILKDIKLIQSNSLKSPNKFHEMSKQFELIYISLMLKIDLKHATNQIKIATLLSKKSSNQIVVDHSLSDLSINTILLLAISSSNNLLEILSHPHTITTVIHQFVKNSFSEQLQSLGVTISLAYLMVIDLESTQEEAYASKMGVSLEQIQKARQLQGEGEQKAKKQELTVKRKLFKEYVVKHWNEIIVELSILLLKIKQSASLVKWGKFLSEIAPLDASRFHHPKIIEVMLQAFKFDKKGPGKFFSILCKKINAQLLKYEQIQSICNLLISNIENGQHELVIFESILGLINLTSNSNNKIKIPIRPLQNCLLEENRYIVHGALELLNNVLVYFDKEEIEVCDKLRDIVEKYIRFYRDQVVNYEQVVPLTDYSHPSRIYGTLISLAIVMDLQKLEEFSDWKNTEAAILKIETPRAITLFKAALYMQMKDKLKGKWWENFGKELAELEKTDRGRWAKLKQYIK